VAVELTHDIVDLAPTMALNREPVVPAVAISSDVAVGLRSYAVHFTMQVTDSVNPFEPTTVDATLELASGAQPVAVALHGSDAELTLPDGEGSARLLVDVAQWDGDCIPGRARAVIVLEMASAATAAACPDRTTADPVSYPADPRVDLGGQSAVLDTISIQARYGRYGAGDFIGPFPGLDLALRPLHGRTGAAVVLRARDASLALTAGSAHSWLRAAVLRPDGTFRLDPPMPGAALRLGTVSSGVLRVTLPSRPGRYIVRIDVGWQTQCAEGGAVVDVAMDVS
jgi:hypothetical protein